MPVANRRGRDLAAKTRRLAGLALPVEPEAVAGVGGGGDSEISGNTSGMPGGENDGSGLGLAALCESNGSDASWSEVPTKPARPQRPKAAAASITAHLNKG